MSYSTLALCTCVLYAPHAVLCGLGLLWQPMLVVMSILAAFIAFLPLVMTGLVFQALRWAGVADVATAAWVVVIHFIGQNASRVGTLHVCLRLQRLGWQHGWLLVRSRFPLVPLSIAVGAGFAAASLLVGSGALLAEALEVGRALTGSGRASSTSTVAAQGIDFHASSGNCARLSRLLQSCFQQTFFSCGQVAWTVMMGQAYAALWPQDVAENLRKHTARANGADETATLGAVTTTWAEEGDSAPMPHAPRAEESVREDTCELLLVDEVVVPVAGDDEPETAVHSVRREHASTAARPIPREEAEASQRVAYSAICFERSGAGAVAGVAPSAGSSISEATRSSTSAKRQDMSSSPSSSAEVAGWLVADSVFAQRLPAAVLTGVAALVLHMVFALLPVAAMAADSASAQSKETSSSVRRSEGCLVNTSLQCVVTMVSVLWGLCIVELERHPFTYALLSSYPGS
ncbi:conserved hypothetical protein [Leishmania major strain Friedlin]|uniref:Uncharacterized protein n=1 Tax=Leishmania major TaxID=5664 RepID=Q4QGS9_LEIMA|nr:conserved hypothetical protein [Leishmania major strain Friedlin]CAG9570420.1 hypothetical_protein_-_conserved [Leishmania major strain Friedlin]CAJ02426.1 conserved hypothetical protein [Leishmania major strain Friedlin]|eukprot:XP_001681619.1 conserved hypothetical protein [Leishmania major strain Friedlin]